MNGICALHIQWFHTINGLSDDVHHTALDLFAGRHHDRRACLLCLESTLQSVGVVHGYAAHGVLTDMLLHLDNEFATVGSLNPQGIMDSWQHFLSVLSLGVEEHVDDRSDNLGNVSTNLCHKLSFY